MTDTLRDRLLVAGTAEIAQHGIANFSLRRVATACNTSCAAPYKHFKNKDEFVLEIVRYINRQWELLRDQVSALFEHDSKQRLVEICVAYIRFWIANPNYRSILSANGGIFGNENSENVVESVSIEESIRSYCLNIGVVDEEETARRIVAVKAITYGITTMLEHGELQNNTKTFEYIRKIFENELSFGKNEKES